MSDFCYDSPNYFLSGNGDTSEEYRLLIVSSHFPPCFPHGSSPPTLVLSPTLWLLPPTPVLKPFRVPLSRSPPALSPTLWPLLSSLQPRLSLSLLLRFSFPASSPPALPLWMAFCSDLLFFCYFVFIGIYIEPANLIFRVSLAILGFSYAHFFPRSD